MPRHHLHPFTPEKLLDLGQRIRSVPAVEYDPWKSARPLTRLEMVGLLKDDIASMRDKGYRVVDIANFLNANGFAISAACLYEAMRDLGCSLKRDPVPLAKRLRDHLAHPECTHAENRLPAEPGRHKVIAALLDPSATKVQQDSSLEDNLGLRLAILPTAQRRLNKLKPSVAIVFKQAVLQLQYGKQRIHLSPETGDAARILAEAGLLNPIHEQGSGTYEVPFEMAHVRPMKRRSKPDRKSGTASE